ncbi:MAG: hypothetical protein JWM34_3095 [Ilumatobacteraceae bacterium]|nr:hypothetical protein [Ilumatobacteraceae bacterium]
MTADVPTVDVTPVDVTTGEGAPVVRLYGIRHHGPGSARAVQRGLALDPPDIVLIEGPREADGIVGLVGHPEMEPPVTMLGYAVDRPDRAVFHPYASFSPEWIAMRWAVDADVPVRHIDLPLANTLAEWPVHEQHALMADADTAPARPDDPLTALASAGGYDDTERWWEDVVEHRDGALPFESIAEAMGELRAAYEPDLVPADPMERRREAQMRTGIRTAVRDGHRNIVVVCGAWHVPALAGVADADPVARRLDAKQARADAALLRGMPKAKVAITWVPWTHRRLASASGYGAGVTSPGWYHHLFTHPGPDTIARWFTEAARLLRSHDYGVSAADVVEATRLATSLASLRGRPLAGLVETNDAARAVLGDGTDAPMMLLSSELVVGTLIGHVPAHTPMVPLARNLAQEQKRCRLKPTAVVNTVELDLRKPLDLQRSRLLHRLAMLRVPWGSEVEGRRSAGTFRETWDMVWEPELEVRLIEAAALGTTIAAAAEAAVLQTAQSARSLAALTEAIEQCLLADVPGPLTDIVQLVADRAALDVDVTHLMEALPALVRTVRYGDVRGTDAGALTTVIDGMVTRIAAGLAPACTSLDADAAAGMAISINDTRAALALLADRVLIARLDAALAELVERDLVHALLQGRATRLLADSGVMAGDAVERRVSRALSIGSAPADGAAFAEGFLGGSGTVLVHDDELLTLIDNWISGLHADAFVDALPLLRRTFGTFEVAERRQIGERVRRGVPAGDEGFGTLDPDRVAAGLHTIAQLLGAGR